MVVSQGRSVLPLTRLYRGGWSDREWLFCVTRGINCKLMAVSLVLKDYRECLCVTSLWSSQAAYSKHSCLIPLFSLCAWLMWECNISAIVWTWSHSFVCSFCAGRLLPAPPSEGSIDGSVITIPNEDNMEQAYTELLFIWIRLWIQMKIINYY